MVNFLKNDRLYGLGGTSAGDIYGDLEEPLPVTFMGQITSWNVCKKYYNRKTNILIVCVSIQFLDDYKTIGGLIYNFLDHPFRHLWFIYTHINFSLVMFSCETWNHNRYPPIHFRALFLDTYLYVSSKTSFEKSSGIKTTTRKKEDIILV